MEGGGWTLHQPTRTPPSVDVRVGVWVGGCSSTQGFDHHTRTPTPTPPKPPQRWGGFVHARAPREPEIASQNTSIQTTQVIIDSVENVSEGCIMVLKEHVVDEVYVHGWCLYRCACYVSRCRTKREQLQGV